MDTFFKVTFGILVGVLGCLGYYKFCEVDPAKERGMKPGWEPIGAANKPASDAPGTSAPPAGDKSQKTPSPDATKPTSRPSATAGANNPAQPRTAPPAPANPYRNDAAYARLVHEDWRRPGSVQLVTALKIPVRRSDGSVAGESILQKGATVKVVGIPSNHTLQIQAGGNIIEIYYFYTDILSRAAKEGTPRPPRYVAAPKPPTPPRTATTTSRSSSGSSSTSSSSKAQPKQQEPYPDPSPPQNATLFGVPIRTD